jgi:S-adenosylmethionine:tRNA-ribosyltransferase-isomerase (queuine synthetase)
MKAHRLAVDAEYRIYSYGDAMFMGSRGQPAGV